MKPASPMKLTETHKPRHIYFHPDTDAALIAESVRQSWNQGRIVSITSIIRTAVIEYLQRRDTLRDQSGNDPAGGLPLPHSNHSSTP